MIILLRIKWFILQEVFKLEVIDMTKVFKDVKRRKPTKSKEDHFKHLKKELRSMTFKDKYVVYAVRLSKDTALTFSYLYRVPDEKPMVYTLIDNWDNSIVSVDFSKILRLQREYLITGTVQCIFDSSGCES